jgi:hypothetical protein
VTRDAALARVRKLLALAGEGSGAADGERRNAAVVAAQLVIAHDLLGAPVSPIDLDEVAALSIRCLELEHQVTTERAAHAADVRARDEQWRQVVERVRREERAAAEAERKEAARKAIQEDRTAHARAAGQARVSKLTHEERRNLGRAGAAARWARWRERQGARAPKSNG